MKYDELDFPKDQEIWNIQEKSYIKEKRAFDVLFAWRWFAF